MACATIHRGFTVPQLLRGASRILPTHSALVVLRHSAFCYCTVNSTIKSKRKMDHLERTANNFRQEIYQPKNKLGSVLRSTKGNEEDPNLMSISCSYGKDVACKNKHVISQAKVCGISNESETVKRLRLAITNKDFTFKAGQWVDFFIPGLSVVGGFSMCSSPGLLKREGILELAVKHTDHPPAHWIHTECTLDSEVAVRVGGDFFFDPQPGDSPVKLVLIAGGVGINPLFSILLHIADLHGYQEGKGNGYKMGTVKLYYSAKNSSQLLFKKNILGLMNAFPGKIMCHFHVTQQSSPVCEELRPHVTEGRISEKDLEKHVSKDTLWYICGPPPMIESISKLLSDIGVPRNCIFFEKWW